VRSYDDPCGVARALDIIGDRWTLLVVRELLFGAKRFTDLVRGLPGMSQNVLSQRLRDLEQSGLARHRRLGPPVSARVYQLTERGAALEPVLIELGRWGSRVALNTTAELSVDALVLALKTTFEPSLADSLDVRCELRFEDDAFRTEITAGTFHAARGPGEHSDVVAETDAATLRGIVFGRKPISTAVRSGKLHIEGDSATFKRFARCFPRPTPL
jgi:DNA-binding HxlR family transcriptional regulator